MLHLPSTFLTFAKGIALAYYLQPNGPRPFVSTIKSFPTFNPSSQKPYLPNTPIMHLDLTPAHLHLALNHIPIIGLAFASLPIVIGILAQSRTTIAAGLLATLLCAGAMPTIMQTGSEASHSFKEGKTLPPLDDAGKIALHMHAGRADKTAPVVYACAILALFALLALVKFPQAALWLSAAVLLGNAISISLSVWTAEAGGRVRHIEFRPKTPWDTPPAATSMPVSTAAVMSPSITTSMSTSTNTSVPVTPMPSAPASLPPPTL